MKALTLYQPWASLMLEVPERPKRNETRGWSTTYRGPLAIHAAKREPGWVREHFLGEPGRLRDIFVETFASWVGHADEAFESLPRGCLLGMVELVDCVPVATLVPSEFPLAEYYLGDYSRGRFAWMTRNPARLVTPIPYRGRQGLWTLPDEVLEGPLEWVGQMERAHA